MTISYTLTTKDKTVKIPVDHVKNVTTLIQEVELYATTIMSAVETVTEAGEEEEPRITFSLRGDQALELSSTLLQLAALLKYRRKDSD